MITWAKTLLPDVVRRIIEATVPFECPVCYDAVANPRIVIPCGHDTCSECLVKIAGNVQEEAIAAGEEAGDAKCPTCRGKIEMKKIIDYDTFKQVHMTQNDIVAADDNETMSEDDGDSIDLSSDTDSTDNESEGSDEDIRNFVVPDDYESSVDEGAKEEEEEEDDDVDLPAVKKESGGLGSKTFGENINQKGKVKEEVKDEDDEDDEDDFVDIKDIKPAKSTKLLPQKEKKTTKHKSKRQRKDKGKRKAKEKSKEPKIKHTSLATLKKDASRSKDGHRRYMRYLRKNWVSSAKVDKCLEILRDTEPDV
jgi:hypothetical protein